jgi:hypothetical protein
MEDKKLFPPNAELVHRKLDDVQELAEHDAIEVIAVSDIDIGKEIFVNYIQSNDYAEVEAWFSLGYGRSYIEPKDLEGESEKSDSISSKSKSKKKKTKAAIDLTDEVELIKAPRFYNLVQCNTAAGIIFDKYQKYEDKLLYTVANKLWERYTELGVKDPNGYEKCVEALEMIETVDEKVMNFIIQVLKFEPYEDVGPYDPHYFVLTGVFEDNAENREFAEELYGFSEKSNKSQLQDQNYANSKGRKMYKMESKKEKIKVDSLSYLDVAYAICWPTYTPSSHQFMWSEKQTMRQGFHTDYNTFAKINKQMSYLTMLSMSDETYLWFATIEKNEVIYERVYYPFGSMLVFTGNMVHAGDAYAGEPNLRVHRYVESPTMIHGELVSQEYKKYADITVQMNSYM